MKHFHGTPISGTLVAQAQVLRGRFAFVPWRAPSALELALEVCRGVAVDCSAYTFWTTGEQPNWMDYVGWVKTICRHPRFEFAVIMDAIDGSEKDNDDLLRLWDKHCWHPRRVIGCPVWHLHESLERLERLVNGRYDIVAMGSSGKYSTPGTEAWSERMNEAFKVICENGEPRCRIHGLRMLRSEIVSAYPFYSCDSTNVAQNGKREALRHKSGDSVWGSEVIAHRIESVQSPSKFTPRPVQYGLFV